MITLFGRTSSTPENFEISPQEAEWLKGRAAQLERYCAALLKYYRPEKLSFWNHPIILQFFNLDPINRIVEAPLRSSKSNLFTRTDRELRLDSAGPDAPAIQLKQSITTQDAVVETIGTQIKGQKVIAQQIYNEVKEQNAIIEGISGKIQNVSMSINKNESKIKKHIL